MTRRSFFTALLGGLAFPFLKPRKHHVPARAAVAPTRTFPLPTLVLVDRQVGIGCLSVALYYDHDDGRLPAPVVISIESYLQGWKSVAWAEARGTPVVVDPPLARAVADRAKVGAFIPEELYAAVAQVAARVSWLRNAGSGSAPWGQTSAEDRA